MDNKDLLGVKKEKTAKTAKTAREALVSPDILTGKLFRILILIFQKIRDIVFIAVDGTFFKVTDFSGFLKLF